MAGPIDQFEVKPLVEITVGDIDLSFTNASAYMFLTVTLASSFLLLATGKARLVPGRWQSSAELLYQFVAKTLRDNAGEQGMRFFPFVFSLFMFILFANMIGMFPYAFTVTSQIIVTFGLAMMVFGTVTLYGLFKHGIGFSACSNPLESRQSWRRSSCRLRSSPIFRARSAIPSACLRSCLRVISP